MEIQRIRVKYNNVHWVIQRMTITVKDNPLSPQNFCPLVSMKKQPWGRWGGGSGRKDSIERLIEPKNVSDRTQWITNLKLLRCEIQIVCARLLTTGKTETRTGTTALEITGQVTTN